MDSSKLICHSGFSVTSADTDMMGRIRLGSLVNLLIQSAIQSADSLGFGYRGLQKEQLFWVLSRLTIEIDRPLEWYEQAEVHTWPKDINGLLYLRDFRVFGRAQEMIARATSGWLAVDQVTKRPRHVNGIHKDLFVKLRERHALEQLPERLSAVTVGEQVELSPSYFDLDLNHHVTATRYIDWVMNTFSLDYHKHHYPGNVSINYIKETLPGEVIRMTKNQINDDIFEFEGINVRHQTSAFKCLLGFKEFR